MIEDCTPEIACALTPRRGPDCRKWLVGDNRGWSSPEHACRVLGGTDPQAWHARPGRPVQEDTPANHSPMFLPVLQPTLQTGTEALVSAALARLDVGGP